MSRFTHKHCKLNLSETVVNFNTTRSKEDTENDLLNLITRVKSLDRKVDLTPGDIKQVDGFSNLMKNPRLSLEVLSFLYLLKELIPTHPLLQCLDNHPAFRKLVTQACEIYPDELIVPIARGTNNEWVNLWCQSHPSILVRTELLKKNMNQPSSEDMAGLLSFMQDNDFIHLLGGDNGIDEELKQKLFNKIAALDKEHFNKIVVNTANNNYPILIRVQNPSNDSTSKEKLKEKLQSMYQEIYPIGSMPKRPDPLVLVKKLLINANNLSAGNLSPDNISSFTKIVSEAFDLKEKNVVDYLLS